MWSNRHYFFTKHSSASFLVITLIFFVAEQDFFPKIFTASDHHPPAISCLWALVPLNISKPLEILFSFQTPWLSHIPSDSLRTLKRGLNQFTQLHFFLRCSAWFIWGRETVGISCILPAGLVGRAKDAALLCISANDFWWTSKHVAWSRSPRARGQLRTSLLLCLQATRALSRSVLSGNWVLQAFISPYFQGFPVLWKVSLNISSLLLVPCPWLDCI